MTLPWVRGYADRETLPRYHAAGIDVVSLTVASREDCSSAVHWIANVTRDIRAHEETMLLCRSIADVDRARAAGKLALVYNLQETMCFEDKLELIELLYDLGVRHALLAYNVKNTVGDGCAERTDAGLSRWGIEVVREMNRVGMLVCGTHSGYRTTMDAMEVTSAPFIFSHSNAYGVYPHYRNIKDDQITACAASGGVIGVNGLGEFLDDHEAKTHSMFRHVDYIAKLVGPEHVGIGLDFVKNVDAFWAFVRRADYMWPANPNQQRSFSKFAQPEQVVELTQLLLDAGYAETDIRGILGENFRRVAALVWK
ncbi:MAG: membrane dipeptidase, partial [Pseudomonadales bacterium]